MRLVALISGGKDSIFNMLQCITAGHEILALANVEPYKKEELDSFMYQSVGQEAVSLVAGALGLPIFRHQTKGTALCKSKTYVKTVDDEVEDLYHLLFKVKKNVQVEGVSVGAIASDYQRTRVENVCSRLNLKCFAYLWKRNQEELLQEMIDAEVEAIIIKVASIGLHPDNHLGMNLKDIKPHLVSLNTKFGVNICGEGGEYESLTLDCPLYHRSISIIDSENVVLSNDAFAPVAFLNIKDATLKSKSWETDDPVKSLQTRLNLIRSLVRNPYSYIMDCLDDVTANIFPQKQMKSSQDFLPFPFEKDDQVKFDDAVGGNVSEYWKKQGSSKPAGSAIKVTNKSSVTLIDSTICNLSYLTGWCSIANVTGSNLADALAILQKHLERINYDFNDAVFVNLYVRDMSDFGNMNKLYAHQIQSVLPPARVCVETVLPPEIGVILAIVAHKQVSKSQKALQTNFTMERDAMHVQSISHWAPANIGPYSQCVKIGGIYYLAGQIPLIPGSMEILNKPILHQCKLSLRHVLRVLKAMDENFTYNNVFQAICYVTSEDIAADIPGLWLYITNCKTATVTAVVVSQLPNQAQLEWEVIGCAFNQPEVIEETQVVEDYDLSLKRCVYAEPVVSSLVCKVSRVRRDSKSLGESSRKSFKLVTQEGLSTVIKNCIHFLRTDAKQASASLCMMKLFYRASDSSLEKVLKELIKFSTHHKVVCTAIPVIGCEREGIFLTVTGICH